MMHATLRTIVLLSTLAALAACSGVPGAPKESAVAMAYNTTGTVAVKPYTRTIFSSIDF